jgi:hypothetical protein
MSWTACDVVLTGFALGFDKTFENFGACLMSWTACDVVLQVLSMTL